MPRLFWSRSVSRVRKSWWAMIGRLITSFLQGKVNPTMTSTIFSPYVDHVMEESKIAYFSGSHGATPSSNRAGIKTVGVALGRVLNDLLPYAIRPIKSKRRWRGRRYPLAVEIYTFRRVWHSHHKPNLIRRIKALKLWKNYKTK